MTFSERNNLVHAPRIKRLEESLHTPATGTFDQEFEEKR